MTNERNQQILETLKKIENNDFNIYFFVLDSKGNPIGELTYIYEHAKILRENGFNSIIVTEKNEYTGVADWLGEEYMQIPHMSVESQNLKIGPQDFLIIPEIFANIMDQTKQFPCKRIVFSQSYDYILEILNIGAKWSDYGIKDCIATTEKQKQYINELFNNINVEVVPLGIPEYFKPTDKLQKPVISLSCRDPRDTTKIVKSFYLKYPQYKWVTFRDMKGLPRTTFAQTLSESCLAVWVDPIASFGTFPIEAMKCGVPVIGRVPHMIPEWMEESGDQGQEKMLKENGIWTYDTLRLPDLIATFIRLWLEDNIPTDVYEKMKDTPSKYTMESMNSLVLDYYKRQVNARIAELSTSITTEKTNA
jgi:glycosyltransferase involved in cell wall biosynthesis